MTILIKEGSHQMQAQMSNSTIGEQECRKLRIGLSNSKAEISNLLKPPFKDRSNMKDRRAEEMKISRNL